MGIGSHSRKTKKMVRENELWFNKLLIGVVFMNDVWDVSMLKGVADVWGYQINATSATEAVLVAEQSFLGKVIREALAEYA